MSNARKKPPASTSKKAAALTKKKMPVKKTASKVKPPVKKVASKAKASSPAKTPPKPKTATKASAKSKKIPAKKISKPKSIAQPSKSAVVVVAAKKSKPEPKAKALGKTSDAKAKPKPKPKAKTVTNGKTSTKTAVKMKVKSSVSGKAASKNAKVVDQKSHKGSVEKPNSLPGISCYCSTYGRPTHVLENSIQCFLEQDYKGPKELVILNDCADQELVFDHPEVRIINHPERIKPLGKKFNMNIELCRYDILATWEDDDFFLRNRLSYGVANMKDGVFHTRDGFFETTQGNIEIANNYFHSQHIFTRELFQKIGGYAEVDQCSLDLDLMEKIRNAVGDYSVGLPSSNDYSYVYVWSGANSYHGSGMGADNEAISDSAAEWVEQQIAAGNVQTGRIELMPKLRYNIYDFLPTETGLYKAGSAKVYYGLQDHALADITAKVIKRCLDEASTDGSWTMPTDDVSRAQIFGDPIPNVVKRIFINVEKEDGSIERTMISMGDECIFHYANGILTFEAGGISTRYFATLYADGCATPSDINEHLPTLYELAKECRHITEMGVRFGSSTRAFLYAAPERLVSYDLHIDETVDSWFEIAKSLMLNYSYLKGNTLEIQIEKTDLLLIDTLHNYDQLKAELALHAESVGRYIVFHDTTSFGEIGESYSGQEELKGIRYAIDEFLETHAEWKIIHDVKNCNGLVVIERTA